ncbi:MAG: cytidylate kinase-like family protein [Clostridia bacterium]|nr:cytidylate kinase-like family protein [Clostridia bacterium]
MSIKVITVSREFGSGGRTIGRLVAERLGWSFYDREIVNAVAQKSGFAEKFIEENGEYANVNSSLLFNLSVGAGAENGVLSLYDEIFNAQSQIIRDAAEKGNCVIVGRCADFILSDRDDCLNVFIYSDTESRKKRIIEVYGENNKPIEKRIRDKDKRRKVYYKSFTGGKWGEMKNYHLAMDSGRIGLEKCADMIVEAVK